MSSEIYMKIVWFLYMVILLPLYLWKENQNGRIKALPYKLTLSSFFCMIALCGIIRHDFSMISILILAGALFSFIGDYYLIYIASNEHKFIKGILCFGITHICYIAAMIAIDGLGVREFVMTAVIAILLLIGKREMKIDMGEAELPLSLYSLLLTFMAAKAFLMLLSENQPLLFQEMFSLGAILFFISDALLGVLKYVCTKKLLSYFVSIFYFLGQLMIVTAMFYQK